MQPLNQLIAPVALAFLLAFTPRGAATLSTNLIPSADTTLFETFADNNLGANANILAGNTASNFRNRALMRFDLTVLPTNATVTSASLTMVVFKAASGPDSDFGLHKMLLSWMEGSGVGNKGVPALTGETTWSNRFYPSTPWTFPGATSGSDFVSAISGSTIISSGTATIFSTPALVADVQDWVSNPAVNYGWILISDNESTAGTARRISSREDPGNEPLLTVEYTLPADVTQPRLTVLAPTNGNFRFTFDIEANHGYIVEYVGALPASNWNTLVVLDPAPSPSSAVIADLLTRSNRFYRVRTP